MTRVGLPMHPEILRASIRQNPLATVTVADGSDVFATHVPLLFRATEGNWGELIGHVARHNPVWRFAKAGAKALVIFHGPHHYISPRWYAAGRANRKAVPTWDYVVVHARGRIEWIEDRAWVKDMVDDLARAFERGPAPWRMEEMPAVYRESILDRIVGLKMVIAELQGTFKLHQGSPAEDRAAVVANLGALGTTEASAMAHAISSASPD